jgi:hypothetical protein
MDIDEEKLANHLRSEQFRESFKKRVEEETWDKGKPMVYLDDNGWVVKHWKDGTIEKIQKGLTKSYI